MDIQDYHNSSKDVLIQQSKQKLPKSKCHTQPVNNNAPYRKNVEKYKCNDNLTHPSTNTKQNSLDSLTRVNRLHLTLFSARFLKRF